MPPALNRPSLKRRLLLTLLLPLCFILLVLGLSGTWLVQRTVEGTSDRVLSGSLQAISETLAMQGGYLTLDLPPSALGMLENSDRDNVYYSISYRGKIITGYRELTPPSGSQDLPLEDIRFRDGDFHGLPIRVAMEAKLVPQLDAPVIVQVAETTKNRTTIAHRILVSLIAGELFLLAVIATLVVLAVDWGLRPLAVLRRAVEALDTDALAALGIAVPALGSLVLGLALVAGKLDAETAHALAALDELFQAEQWGDDEEAVNRRTSMLADIVLAARYIGLTREGA